MNLTLPWPPSVNNLFATAGKRRVKSRAYSDWLTAAGWELKAQNPEPIKGKFRFSMVCYPPDRRRRDLDNLAKGPLDLLKAHGVIEDDSLSKSIHLEWADSPIIIPAHVRISLEAVP